MRRTFPLALAVAAAAAFGTPAAHADPYCPVSVDVQPYTSQSYCTDLLSPATCFVRTVGVSPVVTATVVVCSPVR